MDQELMEIAMNIDLDQEWDDDEIIPPSGYESSSPPSPVNPNPPFPTPSDSDVSSHPSETELIEEEEEVDAPAQHPPHQMKFVSGLKEFDQDYENGWQVIWDEDPGFEDGLPPFTGQRGTHVVGVSPMHFFNFLFRDTMWGNITNQTN